MSSPAASIQRAILISDFTLNSFAGYLKNDLNFPRIDVTLAPFGQVMQVLMDEGLDCWQTAPDLGIVWTRPQAVIRSFNKTLQFESTSLNEILEEVDAYCEALRKLQERLKWVFVPTWVLPDSGRGLGAMDLRSNGGVSFTLMQMNLRLVQNLDGASNCIALDAQKWISRAGGKGFSTKLWYLGKIPFSNDVFKEAVWDLKAAVRSLSGLAKKLIILDLDETLWGGIVGDVGWHDLVLGGHDPVGEALVDFQTELKALKNRGVLLAVVSKNEESIALEAIRKRPEMVLREEDLAGWKINWHDKAKNVLELVSELNIGLDSVVFIDDNPAERARVKEALPEVLVPDWPGDKLLYREALLALDCFDSGLISREDRERANMYVSERQRNLLKVPGTSLEEWLTSLEIRIRVEPLSDANITRVAQLLNKTNQMNLRTRRMTSSELLGWTGESRQLFAFRVTDRFGDSGLTGIVSTDIREEDLEIVDFLLSCRVMGRHVEQAMLAMAITYGCSRGLKRLCVRYVATEKNKPCLNFLLDSGLTRSSGDRFYWNLSDPYPTPSHIEIHSEVAWSTIAT